MTAETQDKPLAPGFKLRVCLRHPEGGISWVKRDKKGHLVVTMYPTQALPPEELAATREAAPQHVFELKAAYCPTKEKS